MVSDVMEIKLDLYDLMAASQTGLLRVFESLRLKQNWGHNYSGSVNDQIAKSISGSCAELAVCKFLDTEFNFHVNHGAKPDIIFHDVHLQVRSQLPKQNNSLIIRPKGSKAGEIYILVIDKSPIYEIHGFVNSTYVLGTDKFLTDFGITDRPKVHALPIEKLTPIKFLKDGAWN